MDLSKAFDTLDHTIMIQKLNYYGITGTALSWFESYLTDRSQFVEVNGIKSTPTKTNMGVPQGSILGPLLFLIYINDINNSSSAFNFVVYADDTTLFTTLERSETSDSVNCNNELDKVYKWLCANKLSLNVQKHNSWCSINPDVACLKIFRHLRLITQIYHKSNILTSLG